MPRKLPNRRACTKCGSVTNEFYKCSRVSDGLTSWCKECYAHYQRERSAKPEVKATRPAYYKKYYAENRDASIAHAVRYQQQNPERVAESRRKYRLACKERVYAKNAARSKRVRISTPQWANLFFIREIYHLAKIRSVVTGTTWHVDHIVPLKGRGVCGLHVEHNLRIIPAQQNLLKSNSLI